MFQTRYFAYRNNAKLVDIVYFTFLLLVLLSCGTGEQSLTITYKVIKSQHAITIDENGVIEAKKSYTIVTPNLNHQSLKIAHIVQEGKTVKKGDLVVQLESEAIENIYLTANNELEIAKAEAEKRKTELELERLLLESQVKSIEASVAVSRLRLENLSFEPARKQEIEKLEIEKNEIDLRKLENKLGSLEAIQKEERLRLQLKIKQEKRKRDQAEQHLQKLKILAPVDGIVIYAEDWYGNKIKEGDQLHPQRPIVEIPDLRIMQLKLKLGETAAQRCKEGQRAEISSFSFGGLILSGKVSKVNRIAKPIKRRSKVKKVEVLVELDSCGTTIVPGISARGKIFISKKEEFFAVPHECVFTKDSLKIIYIQNGGNFEPRAIKIDRQSEEFVLIRSGLKSGEDIAFQEPNEDDIDWPEHLSISVEEELKIDSSDTEIKRKKSIDSLKKEIVVSIP